MNMASNQSRSINDHKTAEKHENPPENSTNESMYLHQGPWNEWCQNYGYVW